MKRSLQAAALALLVVGGLASTAPRATAQTVQPAWSPSGLYLDLAGEIPIVQRPNGMRSPVPIREGESITGFTELETGWIATGTQPARPARAKRQAGARSLPEGSRDLLLVAGGDGPIRRLATPRSLGGTIRGGATPVHDRGELRGLVWLEGDARRTLSVVAADWNGAGWGPPMIISQPARGTQIAPTAIVAEDGTWTVAWSRFDGRDDEIYWSERRGANWSAPQRAHARHAGPDIKPELARSGDGVVLAWSRFDGGDYRAVIARRAGSGWTAPERLTPGVSAFPSFCSDGERTLLLFQHLAPNGWGVAELADTGRIAKRAHSFSTPQRSNANERPVLRSSGAAAELTWPGRGTGTSLVWEIVP